MKKGIVFAGNLLVDQIKFIETYPSQHSLTTITEITRSMGGLVCNCAVDMAKLAPELPVTALGIVGEDEMGEYILEEFGKYPSINTEKITRKGKTSFTDVMTTQDGGRTFFQYRGANAFFGADDIDFEKLDAKILHVGYILLLDKLDGPDKDYPTEMCRVLDQAQKKGIETSIDVVSEEGNRYPLLVPPALAYTDYCIVNELEAGKITGIPLRENDKLITENFKPCAEKLVSMGVKKWVVIHTPEISWGIDVASGKYIEEQSWEIPAGFKCSSVGAGDAFATGILYGGYNSMSLEESIHIAGAVAAYSLSGQGASDAIKNLDDILGEMNEFKS